MEPTEAMQEATNFRAYQEREFLTRLENILPHDEALRQRLLALYVREMAPLNEQVRNLQDSYTWIARVLPEIAEQSGIEIDTLVSTATRTAHGEKGFPFSRHIYNIRDFFSTKKAIEKERKEKQPRR